jgi:hypothetical protein
MTPVADAEGGDEDEVGGLGLFPTTQAQRVCLEIFVVRSRLRSACFLCWLKCGKQAVAAEPWAAVDEMTTPTSTATSGRPTKTYHNQLT